MSALRSTRWGIGSSCPSADGDRRPAVTARLDPPRTAFLGPGPEVARRSSYTCRRRGAIIAAGRRRRRWAVGAGDRVQAAVDRLAAGLGLPVLVEDPRFRPLWWSAQRDVDGPRLRSILQRTVDPSAAALVVRWGLPTAEGPVRTPAAPEADMVPRWCVPLRRDRRLHGYLWVSDPDARVTGRQLAEVVACADRA